MTGPDAPLGIEARALLEAARAGLGPDPAALARIRANVELAATTPGGGLAWGVLAGKLGALAVVAVVATGVALYASRDPDPVSVPVVPALDRPTPSAPTTPPAARTPEAGASDKPHVDRPTPSAPAARPLARTSRHGASDAPARAAIQMPPMDLSPEPPKIERPRARPPVELGREVALIDAAMAAMRRGDPTAALRWVRIHATETVGRGQLAEDAAAIEIEASCARHVDVAKKLAAFDARWPSSAQRARLTTACP